MTFSIIIPAYNASTYILRCLDSVVNQDFPKDEYEIIVIDDCSADETASVIEKYIADNQQITPPQQTNPTMQYPFNQALGEQASGRCEKHRA